jgi:hypothetical protein
MESLFRHLEDQQDADVEAASGSASGITNTDSDSDSGKFHDQGDAKWIKIRGQLKGHNETPCG